MKKVMGLQKLVRFIQKVTGYDKEYILYKVNCEGAACFNYTGVKFTYLGFDKWQVEE